MRESWRHIRGLTLGVLCILLLIGACGGDKRQKAMITDLRSQVSELNRNVADAQVRIEELNNRLFLMQEQLEAECGALGRVKPPPDLKVVKLVPGTVRPAEAGATPAKALTSSPKPDKNRSEGETETKVISNWKESDLTLRPEPAPEKSFTRAQLVREYRKAYDLYRSKQYDQAVEAFARFLKTYGASDYGDNAAFWMGVCLFEQGKWDRAIAELNKVRHFAGSNKSSDALYYIGLAYSKKGDLRSARNTWRELVKLYPKSEAAKKARTKLAGGT